jgi:hypothetical protein
MLRLVFISLFTVQLSPVHITKAYVEVLTSALDGDELSASRSDRFTMEKDPTV